MEAQLLQALVHLQAHVLLHEPAELGGEQLNAGHVAVDAHPQLMKAQIQQVLLRRVHHVQLLLADGLAVHEARRQAGEGLLVPGGQAQLPRERADVRLVESRRPQRTLHAQLPDGDQAGAVVAVVVQVGALRDGRDAPFPGDGPDLFEQLVLAEVAAVRGIFAEALDVQLLRAANHVLDAVLPAEGLRLLQLPLREGAGGCRHGDGARPQHVVGHLQQKGGVHAAGEGHRHAAQFAQVILQRPVFFLNRPLVLHRMHAPLCCFLPPNPQSRRPGRLRRHRTPRTVPPSPRAGARRRPCARSRFSG